MKMKNIVKKDGKIGLFVIKFLLGLENYMPGILN